MRISLSFIALILAASTFQPTLEPGCMNIVARSKGSFYRRPQVKVPQVIAKSDLDSDCDCERSA